MLNPKNFGLAAGILWGLCIFVFTLIAVFSGLWMDTMKLVVSLYPGYTVSIVGAFVGLVYGFVDAFVCFYIFAWLYNKLEKK